MQIFPKRGSPACPSDWQCQIVNSNCSETPYPRDTPFHRLFEEQADRSPEAWAIEAVSGRLTYRELNARANQLAARLLSRGVGPEVLVGICLESSPHLLVALLAVLKAGGAYVPLDPTYPKDRLNFMISDSGMRVLITEEAHAQTVSTQSAETLNIDAADVFTGAEAPNPVTSVTSDNVAYVIYTSGSTGQPKGVVVPHRGLVNYLFWAAAAYRMDTGDGALVHSSVSFDLTITGLFGPLLVGKCVYLLKPSEALEKLSTALTSGAQFSVVKITPAHLQVLAAQLSRTKGVLRTGAFIIGGEALLNRHVDYWRTNSPDVLLVNEYGPTETVVGCCVYFVRPQDEFSNRVPIGKPIANTQLFVLDNCQCPVSPGEIGELYIAGDGVARGYLNRPDLTAKKFLPNPFAGIIPSTSSTMYRTGDLARYLPNGNLEFLGRCDDQIKIRGFRIEPAEIEAALLKYPEVAAAVVKAHSSPSGENYLAAYIVSQCHAPLATPDLRGHLRSTLPDYMVPSTWLFLDSLPLTVNGKVDRAALQPVAPATAQKVENLPGADLERKIIQIWTEALGRPVGLDDNFFDIGGNSLLAVRIIQAINAQFQAQLDPIFFYRHPSIPELALELRHRNHGSGPELIELRSGHKGSSIIFLNPPLEFIRIAKHFSPDEALYISEVPLPKNLLDAALRFETEKFPTLAEIVDAHVALITTAGIVHPISLAGYSSYATIAFEVARALLIHGISIDTVFAFDADMKAPRAEILKVLARRHLKNIKSQGLPYLYTVLKRKVSRFLESRHQAAAARENEAPSASLSNADVPWSIFARFWNHAMSDYQPHPVPSRGVLFRADISIYGDVHDYDGFLGWNGLFTEGLEIIGVPGDHSTMWIEPNVSVLTSAWEKSLERRIPSAGFRATTQVLLAAATFAS